MADLNVKRLIAWRGNMRKLTWGQARTWLTRARESWMSMPMRGRIASHRASSETDGRRRLLGALGFAISVVGGAVLLRRILHTSADEPQFWLFHVAIALSAAYAGTAATLVATLLSVLLARIGSDGATFDGVAAWPRGTADRVHRPSYGEGDPRFAAAPRYAEWFDSASSNQPSVKRIE